MLELVRSSGWIASAFLYLHPPSLLSPAVLLFLSPWASSIHPFTSLSLPSPCIFTPPSLFGPLPLSASLRGKSAACVAWQHACSHPFPSSPPFYPTSPFSFSSHPNLSSYPFSICNSISHIYHLTSILLVLPPFVPVTLSTCF